MGRRPLVKRVFDHAPYDAIDDQSRYMRTATHRNGDRGRRRMDRSITMRCCSSGWGGFDCERRRNGFVKPAAAFRSRCGSSGEYSREAAHERDPENDGHGASGDSHHFAFYPDARTTCVRSYRRLPVDCLTTSFFSNPSSSDRRYVSS